jgi:hypothetical protein
VADDTPPMRLLLTYIEAAQRARASGDADDFAALREFLAPDVLIKAASPWTDEPWRVIHRGADAVIARLQAPINKSTSLTTRTSPCSRPATTYTSSRCRRSSMATAPTSAWCATSFRWSMVSSRACGATATSAGSPLAETLATARAAVRPHAHAAVRAHAHADERVTGRMCPWDGKRSRSGAMTLRG